MADQATSAHAAETATEPTNAAVNGSASHAQPNGHVKESNQHPDQKLSEKPKPKPKPKSKSKRAAAKGKPKPKPSGGVDFTRLPEVPQGYTLKFTFRSASNLPPADINTGSSDPFLHATLKVAGLKRHKEDPDLTHRTPTLRRTLEPEWNDEWIVANVPASGFSLKCRLYDEDSPNKNDRLGNVTIKVPQVFDDWEGIPAPGRIFAAKKRVISKRAYVFKAVSHVFKSDVHMTPRVQISIELVGRSDPPHAQLCTLGPTAWIKHYSPMIGRLAGTKVNENEDDDRKGSSQGQNDTKEKNKSQRYDFQANEMQLSGPIPASLYHRYVAFKPIISRMFLSNGVRGRILNKALHKQHNRVYNFDRTTECGPFEPCSEAASQQLLKMAHYDEGCRVFTYVLTLDSLIRFTETGKEFGIDLLSKHTMHSDVQTYIAFSGEFFIRRLEHPDASEEADPNEKTHPDGIVPGGPPEEKPPHNPAYYQLVIDNDSGTYRPDKSLLPDLKSFLERNFPGLGVVAMHWEDEELQKMKKAQRSAKKEEGQVMHMVMNNSVDSFSSAESELASREENWEHTQNKKEAALETFENPRKLKEKMKQVL